MAPLSAAPQPGASWGVIRRGRFIVAPLATLTGPMMPTVGLADVVRAIAANTVALRDQTAEVQRTRVAIFDA